MLKFGRLLPNSSHFSLFVAPFGLLAALFDHLVALRWLYFSPKGPANPFSTTLTPSGRATQLPHYCCQPAPQLLGTNLALVALPSSQYPQPRPLGYDQLVVNQTDHRRPQLEVLCLTQPGLAPQQILFVEPIAVLYR